MQPFRYHEGQRVVQREANSVICADKLSTWVGPVVQFATLADLIVLANREGDGFRIGALSGRPPLVSAVEEGGEIRLGLPGELGRMLPVDHACGGIVINPAEARRSRVSGVLRDRGDRLEIRCEVAFTNCRKYMAPTASTGDTLHAGPTGVARVELTDPWVGLMLAGGETAFLVTATPEGVADVSHRGGQPGFLQFSPAAGTIEWTEYLGDGMFVSTGNLRSGGAFSLIVLDFVSGDALRLNGEAGYTNLRTDRKARVDALIQAGEPFPVQGRIAGTLRSAERLVEFCHPRERVAHRSRITSEDTTRDQHP